MKFRNFVVFLFSIYEISFNLVVGQTTNVGKSDCTVLFNYIRGDNKDYASDCCLNGNNIIACDNEGYITYFNK